MKKNSCLILILLLLSPMIKAQEEQEVSYSILSADSIYDEVGLIPEVLDENINSLLKSWHANYFLKKDDYCLDNDENVIFSDAIYEQRLAKMPCIIPMEYNPIVRSCIDLYANRRRDLVRYMMGMADLYFPLFEQVLDEHNLPIELKYLAVVESALNPRALSRVGAAGLWQFMLPTGKIYGLEINSLIDERLDPYKATHAACRYFEEMYAIYGDWYLVLASYNCGPGNVNKAIRRAGGKTNFWEIFKYLPRETRSYVPLFIAANYIMNYHCEHNLCPLETSLSVASDTIMVHKMLHLQQVSEVLDVDIELLRTLNPQYKREIIPGNIMPSPLKLPIKDTYQFIDIKDSIYLHRLDELLADCEPVNASDLGGTTKETIKHTVQHGENLYTIANKYGVTAQNLRKWNRLKSNRVPSGRKVTVHINNGGITYAAQNKPASSTEVAVKKTEEKKVASTTTNKPQKSSTTKQTQYKSYKVKSGDSLYSISKRHPGVTVAKLQSTNKIKGNKIRIGQILKIPIV